MGPIGTSMKASLEGALDPVHLELHNDSGRHAGHAGAQEGPIGETHWTVVVVSPRFEGLSLVKRQQAVYEALHKELAAGVHALSMRTLTPEEWSRR